MFWDCRNPTSLWGTIKLAGSAALVCFRKRGRLCYAPSFGDFYHDEDYEGDDYEGY